LIIFELALGEVISRWRAMLRMSLEIIFCNKSFVSLLDMLGDLQGV
jgi:hypothetical protein